ncbi:MAG TPA: hypothetical protein VMU37_00905 [Caulobacteraceae bacterium]|nr:hypothetical protein [Caulobacteraceae bacterium]
MARIGGAPYVRGMETDLEIANRWRYLRQLLREQLAQFEAGTLQIHAGAHNVSEGAIERLKKEIEDFDGLISVSERRSAKEP